MAFCATCGTEVQGKFCSKCGATNSAAMGGGPAGFQAPAGAPAMEENVVCALCYLLFVLTGIIFLVMAPYNQNKLVRFHAFQSIFTWVALMGLWIAMIFVHFVLVLVPVVGPLLNTLIYLILGLGGTGIWLFLMYKAYNKEKFILPVIGPLAEQQA